jgi:hypothetical protein
MVSPSNHWNDWNKLSWAAVRDVPNVTRQEVTVRARHRFSLEGPFHGQKASRIHSDNGLNDLNVAQRLNNWNGFC